MVHVWAGTFQAKKTLGTIFRRVVGFPFYSETLGPSDHEKDHLLNRKRFFQGPKFGFTFVSGLAPFKLKNPWEPFLEKWLDLHFKGAALHKTDSSTVLITYSFAVCVNILQYYCPLTPPLPLL